MKRTSLLYAAITTASLAFGTAAMAQSAFEDGCVSEYYNSEQNLAKFITKSLPKGQTFACETYIPYEAYPIFYTQDKAGNYHAYEMVNAGGPTHFCKAEIPVTKKNPCREYLVF